jgi:hypothetical protein
MANGAFKFKDNSGNVVSFISGSGANISFSGGTLDLSGMTGLTLGNLTLSGTTQNAISASHAASYLLTSSFNTYSGTTNTLLGTLATTGSNLFKGSQTISGSVIPAVTDTYDLGSETNQFRHLYLSSASLYIDGTKVLGSTTQELQITTDTGQSFKILEDGSDNITLQSADGNIELKSSGGGDVILDPTTGVIALKGTTTLYAGNKILSSDGNAIQIGNSATITGSLIVTGFIETQELRTTYISSSILYRSGSTKFGDELSDTHSFTGSLLVSGTISVPGSGLISGSAQILNGSGVWSGSAQLPSGLVSGSVQVDVMSTTNIARLATTGSNTFSGNIRTTGLSIGVAPTSNILDVRGENGTFDGTIVLGARGTIQHRDGGQTILSIANDYNSDSAKMEFRMKGNTTGDAKLTILGSGASTFSSTLQANGKIFLQRASTGADTLLQFKNEVGVDKAYIKFGGVNEELAFYSGAGGTRNLIIDADGSMGFNTPTFGVRSFLFKAIAGRQLAIEALESGGVHAIYLRPSSSGRNLITSNYFSGGAYLPLALSGRENDVDLVLHTNGNISVGSATDGGVKLAITGANSADGQLYVGNTDVTYSAGVNFTTSGTNRGFVGWRHTNSGAPFTLTGIHLFNIDNSNIVFGTNNTVKAVINVDGNLGINDNNPQTRLSVNGANYVEMATFACTTSGAAAIVSGNSGHVQFSSGNARHNSNTSLFVPVTDGIQITKAGIVYVTFSQDITTAGTTGYVAGYIQKNKSAVSENLITNTNGEWDGINGCTTINVAVNDVINFFFSAAEITSFDPNTWSNYSFVWTSR